MSGDMICGTYMMHLDSPEHEAASLVCFLALGLVSRVDYMYTVALDTTLILKIGMTNTH